MKKVKLLVTGPILEGASEAGCMTCHYDFSWLIEHPSTLIYPDNIILTTDCDDLLQNEKSPYYGKKIGKALQTVFDVAKEFNLIEVKKINSVISPELDKEIYSEIEQEREVLAKRFPKNIRLGPEKVPNQIFINDHEYCGEILWSINASLILSKYWGAESLYPRYTYEYLNYKFLSSTTSSNPIHNQASKLKAFDNFFNVILPEKEIFPYYALDDVIGNRVPNHCGNCSKTEQCKKSYLDKIEDTTWEILEFRETEEIQQIKGIFQDITQKLEDSSGNITDKDITREFRKQEAKINHDLKVAFPKIKNWTNLSLIASAYAGLYGAQTGLPLASMITYATATLATTSLVAKIGVEHYENQHRWVGFLQQQRKEKKTKCIDK